MADPLLQVQHLTLSAQSGPIVSDLSFSIHPGEIIALTGKSGSGKTSVALSLMAMLPKGIQMTQGAILWNQPGAEISLPANQSQWVNLRGSHIGFTQQDAFGAFDPVLMMGPQMRMIIAERTPDVISDIDNALQSKMQEAGLRDIQRIWSSYPHQLSGGQLQRCQIAMALVMRPALLICDEPTSALDPINQMELMDVYVRMRDTYGIAIMLITHEVRLARLLADREISLDHVLREGGQDLMQSPPPQQDLSPEILRVTGLEYKHKFGGWIQKSGTSIGPFDFSLQKASGLGIAGESGSGKSTLAQMLVGLLTPAAGQMILNGEELSAENANDLRALRTSIQLVMQDGRGSLHPYLTIREQFSQVLAQSDMITALDQRMKDCLAMVSLSDTLLDRRPDQLSGGECLRVSIARALLLNPQILVCDESTSALDPIIRNEILEVLSALKSRQNLALIMIAHDAMVLQHLADHLLVLEEGKIVEAGPIDRLMTAPSYPLTMKLFPADATLFGKSGL